MRKQVSYKIVSLVFGVLVLCFALAFYAIGWDEPLQAPPGCTPGDPGCDPPVNVGTTDQVKEGGFGVYGVFRAVGGADPATEPGLVVNNGNVGIGTTAPSAKLEVNGDIRAKNGILMAGTLTIVSNGTAEGISAPIDVSVFGFSSPDDYQVILTSHNTGGAQGSSQVPCFTGIGCYGPVYYPIVVDKTATSFRIVVHDNDALPYDVIVPVDYIVVRY